jgi:hypothetical protein
MGIKLSLAYLQLYRYRAYILNKTILKLDKLTTRVYIGYLIGYNSINIFRIWIPSIEKVIRTRDITFDKKIKYSISDIDLAMITKDGLNKVIQQIETISSPDVVQQIDDNIWDIIIVEVLTVIDILDEEESDSILTEVSEDSANKSLENE